MDRDDRNQRVNREKSAVAPVGERKFLGHRLLLNSILWIAPMSIKRAKEKVRQITRLKKPPYTTSMYGGVGGRGREAPPTRSRGRD